MLKTLTNYVGREHLEALLLVGLRGLTLVIKLLTSLFVTRFLGLESVGIYGLVLAASVAAPSILGLGLAQTIMRRAVTETAQQLARPVLFYVLFVSFVVLMLTFAIIATGGLGYGRFELVIVGLLILFECLNSDAYQLQINLSRYLTANLLHFLRSSLWAIVFMAVAYLEPEARSIDVLLFAWMLGSFVSLVLFYWILRDWPWFAALRALSTLPKWLVDEVKISYHLYLSGVAVSIATQADKYVVSYFVGLELTGVYVLFWQVFSAISNLLYVGVIQTARPKLVRLFHTSADQYSEMLRLTLVRSILSSIALAIPAGIFIHFLLPYLQRPLLEDWEVLLYPILLSCVFQVGSEALRLGFYAQHADQLFRNLSFAILFLMLVVYGLLLWLFGLWGGAMALLITCLSQMLIRAYFLYPYLRKPAS